MIAALKSVNAYLSSHPLAGEVFVTIIMLWPLWATLIGFLAARHFLKGRKS